MAEKNKDEKHRPKVEIITPKKAEKELPPPASEAQVSHAHELADEDTARQAQETAQEGERRKAGDPLGRVAAAENAAAETETQAEVKGKKGEDHVDVIMAVSCTPPNVGGFDVRRELGLERLEERKKYSLPRNVAAVLVDANKAALVE